MEEQQNLDETAKRRSVASNSQSPQHENEKSISKDGKSLIARILTTPTLADATTVVGFFLGGVGLAVAYLDSSVNTRIEKRVVPFESYMQGVSFKVNEDFDRAIPLLEKAYNEIGVTLDYKITSADVRYPVIEHYLAALANSENPDEHLHRMNNIVQQEATRITLNPYSNMHAGWFYLRAGEPAKARERLRKAAIGFDVRRIYTDSAFCYYALMLLDLAEGDPNAAYLNAQEAASRNSSRFGLPSLKSQLRSFTEEGWYQKLTILYPELQEAINSLEPRL